MPRMPRVTGAEIMRAMRALGWIVAAQRGSHVQLKHPDRPGRVTIPIHAGKIIGPRMLAMILAQAGLSVEEFRSAL